MVSSSISLWIDTSELTSSPSPGRFFAIHTMKTVLACMLLGWIPEPLEKRPKYLEIADLTVPSEKTKVKFRRRNDSDVVEPSV